MVYLAITPAGALALIVRSKAPVIPLWLEGLTEDYPDFEEMDKVLFILGMAFGKGGDPDRAVEVFERLGSEYPESPFAKKIPNIEKFKRKEKKQT